MRVTIFQTPLPLETMKYLIRIVAGLACLSTHTQVWSQAHWQVGIMTSVTHSIARQTTPDIAGVSKRISIHPQYQLAISRTIHKSLGLETGIGLQYHGMSFRYVPDTGIHEGNKRFLRKKGWANMFAIPLLASFQTKPGDRLQLRFVAGAVWLVNPWLDSYITTDGRSGGGTDSLLYTRGESWVLPFSTLNFMSRIECLLQLKGRKRLALGLVYQKGSRQTLRQTRFSYSLFTPVYDNRIVWVNRGDMIGLSIGIVWGIRPRNR